MADSKTTVKELKDIVRKFCEARDWDKFHDAKELSIGISTEASELLQHFRFKSKRQVEAMLRKPEKREKINKEVADVFYFTLRLAQRYGIDLATELKKKIAENEKRYPISKFKGSNKRKDEV